MVFSNKYHDNNDNEAYLFFVQKLYHNFFCKLDNLSDLEIDPLF